MANNAKRSPVKLVTDEAKPVEAVTAATVAIEAIEPPDAIAAKAVMDDVIAKYAASDKTKGLAKGDFDKASEAHDGTRVSLILALAKAALNGNWEFKYALLGIDNAIKAYREARNSTEDSLNQFRSEIARAIHPNAREHVEHDLERARVQWAAETKAIGEAKKEAKEAKTAFRKEDVDAPLHNSFAKSYHAVFQKGGLLDARAEARTPEAVAQIEDLDDFCAARGAKLRRDPKRCASLIKQALQSLEVVASEYPEAGEDWETVMDFLKSIDAKRLETLRTMREEEAKAAKRQAERKAKALAGPTLRKSAANAKALAGVDKLTD